jgi:hypothetical protein
MINWAHGRTVCVAPGSLPRVGKGDALHSTSTSFRVLVAGKLHIAIRVRKPRERRKYIRRRLAGGRKGVKDDLRAVDQLVSVNSRRPNVRSLSSRTKLEIESFESSNDFSETLTRAKF